MGSYGQHRVGIYHSVLNADTMPKIISFGGNKITKLSHLLYKQFRLIIEAGETSVEVLQNILNGEEVKKLNVIDITLKSISKE